MHSLLSSRRVYGECVTAQSSQRSARRPVARRESTDQLADIALFAWTRPTDLVQALTSRAKMYRQKQATELSTDFPEPIRSILNTKATMTAFNVDWQPCPSTSVSSTPWVI